MKISLMIEGDLEQIVLTPETDAEHRILDVLHHKPCHVRVRRGHFENAVEAVLKKHNDCTSEIWHPAGPGTSTIIVRERREEEADG